MQTFYAFEWQNMKFKRSGGPWEVGRDLPCIPPVGDEEELIWDRQIIALLTGWTVDYVFVELPMATKNGNILRDVTVSKD
jgi:hypothetical protein